MSLTLNTNLSSLNAQRHLSSTQSASQTAMARLSSGLRVNSAKDDAAGLAIGSKMEAQVRGLNQATRNANDAISLLQTADGGLQTMSNIFQRMRELAVQAANGGMDATATTGDYAMIDKEYQELSAEVTRIAGNTKINGQPLIDGTNSSFDFQVGANDTANDQITVNMGDATGYLTVGDLTSAANATTEIGALDTALASLNSDRAVYGAALSKLDFTVADLQNSAENQTAARSRVMDADYSAESANLAKAQVLQQAGIAMVAQANQQPQQILSLLR